MSNPANIADALANNQLQSLINSGGNPSPFLFPDQWDRVSFAQGALVWNGKVQFKNAKRSFNWQVKTPPGVQGEVYTYRGLHTKPFSMRLECWTDAQWQQLPALLDFFNYDAVKPSPNGPANPVDIYHPALSIVHISQVLCLDIDVPEIDQERTGAAWVTLTLREFRPAPAVNVTTTPTATQVPIVVLNRAGGSTGATIQQNQQAIQNEAGDLPATLP